MRHYRSVKRQQNQRLWLLAVLVVCAVMLGYGIALLIVPDAEPSGPTVGASPVMQMVFGTKGAPPVRLTEAKPAPAKALSDQDIARILRRMTLEQKVGQMLMVGFAGGTTAGAADFISKYHVGGLVVRGTNAVTTQQLAGLTRSLQKMADADSGGLHLLLATDQEGGRIAHIGPAICPKFPSNADWGATNDIGGLVQQAQTTADVFKQVGLNMNLAPVLDVNTNPDNKVIGARSYGGDPTVVAQLGCNYIMALQDSGVIATAKHFPGHGSTSVDSHKDTPTAVLDQQQMVNDLYPFYWSVIDGVDAVMTAHIVYERFDALPATLSSFWVRDVLRGRLGYQGVVITDSLGMGAIRKHYSSADVVRYGLEAGIDIFLICEGDDIKAEIRQCLLDAARSSSASMARVDESVTRILRLKAKYGLVAGRG